MKSIKKLAPRRVTAVLYGLIVLAAGCSSVTPTSAAEINDIRISRDELELTLIELSDAGQTPIVDGEVKGDTARSVLTALVQGKATLQLLDIYGQLITDADRDAVRSSLSQNSDTSKFTEHLKTLIVDLNAGTIALKRITAPDVKKAAEMYQRAPASLGVMCVRHIVVKTLDEANNLLGKIGATGEDFATLAGTFSIEPNAKQSGGALTGANNACMKLSEYQTNFDADFTAGALKAKPGIASGPVKSSFGYHIIYVRPFVEVAPDISTLLATDPGELLLTGFIATSKINIDSAYGRWNAASGSIIAN